ncbi:hypothetical protein, partial [Stenotrophomonas sp. PS02298]|uniref:hypothetical protein n=1 Tax=Stenotrophomonas sp. PS02298 TaxID=2991424 RepID=UPI00249C5AB2
HEPRSWLQSNADHACNLIDRELRGSCRAYKVGGSPGKPLPSMARHYGCMGTMLCGSGVSREAGDNETVALPAI